MQDCHTTYLTNFCYYYYYYNTFIYHPFKIAYSESLPAQPLPNITVLRAERKEMERSTGIWRSVTGRPFQVTGPATEKARPCLVAVLERETISTACAAGLDNRGAGLAWWSNKAHASMDGLGP